MFIAMKQVNDGPWEPVGEEFPTVAECLEELGARVIPPAHERGDVVALGEYPTVFHKEGGATRYTWKEV